MAQGSFLRTSLVVLMFVALVAVTVEAKKKGRGRPEGRPDRPRRTEADCELEMNPGDECEDSTESRKIWYYNSESSTCVEFDFTGCGGNNNRFRSERGCKRLCQSDNGEENGENDDNGENEGQGRKGRRQGRKDRRRADRNQD